MKMVYGLTGIGAAVGNHAVAIFQTLGPGDLRDHLKDVGHNGAVVGGDIVDGFHVGLGHHQNVGGSLGAMSRKAKTVSSS